jgi:hypothetical protein
LRKQVGLQPTEILAAPIEQLVSITKLGGIHPELRAQRLKEIAHIVLNDFAGDLGNVLQLPYPKAIKELKRFPSIGEPGAEKILLFTQNSRGPGAGVEWTACAVAFGLRAGGQGLFKELPLSARGAAGSNRQRLRISDSRASVAKGAWQDAL